MRKLGITGGLGSGKSTAARFFAHQGAWVFDADSEAKKLLRSVPAIQSQVVTAFGREITDADGRLDFNRLARAAFRSPDEQQKLNRILWPEVRRLIKNEMKTAEIQSTEWFIVDAALLMEAKYEDLFDLILLITADKDIRIRRAMTRSSLSEEQILKRMNLQMPEDEKIKRADITVLNNENIPALESRLTELILALRIHDHPDLDNSEH